MGSTWWSKHLDLHAEEVYWHATATGSYAQMAEVRQRVLELLHHQLHRRTYRKRTELVVEVVQPWETEGHCPQAHYAFDNGVLTIALTRLIERGGKQWVSESECSRQINWRGQWRRVDQVAAELRVQHPESFRPVTVKCRNGEEKPYWVFSKVVRLKKSLNFSRFVAGKQAAECDGSTPKGSCEPTEILRVAS